MILFTHFVSNAMFILCMCRIPSLPHLVGLHTTPNETIAILQLCLSSDLFHKNCLISPSSHFLTLIGTLKTERWNRGISERTDCSNTNSLPFPPPPPPSLLSTGPLPPLDITLVYHPSDCLSTFLTISCHLEALQCRRSSTIRKTASSRSRSVSPRRKRGLSSRQGRSSHSSSPNHRTGGKRIVKSLSPPHTTDIPLHAAASQPVAEDFYTGARPMTYAQAVGRGTTGGYSKTTGGSQYPNPGRPVDPLKEGRCLRCLERGHIARDCRDPIKCRLCRQGGHRQVACPLKNTPRFNSVGTGLFACLIGDVGNAETSWANILERIQSTCPDLPSPDCHPLVSGGIFIRGLSKGNWRRLHGVSWQLPKGGSITWRRPQPTDGAYVPQKIIRRIEARGVPFGLRTWNHLERLLRPVGSLRKIVCNGLKMGDPNCLYLDVEMEVDSVVPRGIIAPENPGIGTKISLAVVPPPPPMHQPTHPQSASGAGNTEKPKQSSDTGKKQSEQQWAGSPPTCQAPRSPKIPPRHPETVDDKITQPEMESLQTPDTATVSRDDGHQDSLLLYRRRRRLQRPPTSPLDRCDRLARQEKCQWTTENADISPLVPDTDPHEIGGTLEISPTGQIQTEEKDPTASFIPASISLPPTTVVAMQMGAGNGVLPSPS